jgi:c-di-GMP-binding flagellar brake protein YcgR
MPRLFLEKRRNPRVDLPASGLLVYEDGMYLARLENISLSGALVALQDGECPPISRGERCSLALYRSGGEALRLSTRMVHLGYDMVCVRFVNMDQNTRLMLRSIIARQMPETCRLPARSSQLHSR